MQSEMPAPGSYEPFRLKEKIGEMMKYGRPLTKNFSRKDRDLADDMRVSMLKMYHLAVELETDGTSTVYGWVDAAAITGKASATPAVKTYTVKAGDSLWRIAAQQLGNGARYKEIKTLNGLKNNTIHAGQVLKLPN